MIFATTPAAHSQHTTWYTKDVDNSRDASEARAASTVSQTML